MKQNWESSLLEDKEQIRLKNFSSRGFDMAGESRVLGYGERESDAVKDAERKLPYPIRDMEHYDTIHTGDPTKIIPAGNYKVEITYVLRGTKEQAPKPQRRGTGPALSSRDVQFVKRLPR